jgi:hypothetical protein
MESLKRVVCHYQNNRGQQWFSLNGQEAEGIREKQNKETVATAFPALKIEAAVSTVTLVTIYQTTWYHIPEDSNLKNNRF